MFTLSNSIRRTLVVTVVSLVPAFGMAQAATAHAAGAAAAAGMIGNDAAANEHQDGGAAPAARAKVYCTGRTPSGDMTVTGSMLKRKVCKTREQWLADGVRIEDGK